MINKKIKTTRCEKQPIGEANVTLQDLAASLGLDEKAVAESLAELEAHNMIKTVSKDKFLILHADHFI